MRTACKEANPIRLFSAYELDEYNYTDELCVSNKYLRKFAVSVSKKKSGGERLRIIARSGPVGCTLDELMKNAVAINLPDDEVELRGARLVINALWTLIKDLQ